jgi:hypothetical protein
VKASGHLTLTASLAAAANRFSIGMITMAPVAEASAAHRYTLRVGDRMTIPAVGQLCTVYMEGGAPDSFARGPGTRATT